MKGVVFNLFFEVVTRAHGEDEWDAMLAAAGVEGAYTSLGTYPDDEFVRLAHAAAQRRGNDDADVIRWIGREGIALLAESYPAFFTPHEDARSFVLTINDIIHPEVRKLYPGAAVPEFAFEERDDGGLVMTYSSARRLCAFGEGLLQGAAGHYGQTAEIDQPSCMHRGDPACSLSVRFT